MLPAEDSSVNNLRFLFNSDQTDKLTARLNKAGDPGEIYLSGF